MKIVTRLVAWLDALDVDECNNVDREPPRTTYNLSGITCAALTRSLPQKQHRCAILNAQVQLKNLLRVRENFLSYNNIEEIRSMSSICDSRSRRDDPSRFFSSSLPPPPRCSCGLRNDRVGESRGFSTVGWYTQYPNPARLLARTNSHTHDRIWSRVVAPLPYLPFVV